MRVRNFVLDDAYIFCTEDQIQEEVSAFIDLLYVDYGFKETNFNLSTRQSNESVLMKAGVNQNMHSNED